MDSLLSDRGREQVCVLLSPCLEVNFLCSSPESAFKTVLAWDTLNTVGGIEVLDEDNLPACGSTLAGCNGGRSQEIFPDLDTAISTQT